MSFYEGEASGGAAGVIGRDEDRRQADSFEATLDVVGAVTGSEQGVLTGWARSTLQPDVKIIVEAWRGETFLGEAIADLAGSADTGHYGHNFSLDVASKLLAGIQTLEIFAAKQNTPLNNGLVQIIGQSRDGTVAHEGYLYTQSALETICTTPYEHYAYEATSMAPDRLAPRLINRLRRERAAFGAEQGLEAVLLLQIGVDNANSGWELQSYPKVRSEVAPANPAQLRKAVQGVVRVYFALPGDVLHPSTVATTSRIGAEVVTWLRFEPSEWRAGAPGRLRCYPAFDRITAQHGAASDTTLCMTGDLLATAPDDVLSALAAGRLHPLHFWLSTQPVTRANHPEGLTLGPAPLLDAAAIAADLAFYEGAVQQEGNFTLTTGPNAAAPMILLPVGRAQKISVLICFRDHADTTLACLRSLQGQYLTGELEVVLVDNQSSPREAEQVRQGATRLFGAERVVFLSYDRTFNHSAQNNLAARHATGEVLVICNNDVIFADPTALEQMAAWALTEGIGAVGCRLDDPQSGRGSYGHVITAPRESPYQVPVAENSDATFGHYVHGVVGSTLALAAIAKSRFLALGGLDEVDFPIGYNDVEFMFRASREGLRHLYLGHVHAIHERGSSRTGDNEAVQALRMNTVYAHELGQRRRFLNLEMVPPRLVKGGKSAGPRGKAEKDAARAREREALRQAATAQLEATRKEIDAVYEALSKAQSLILNI